MTKAELETESRPGLRKALITAVGGLVLLFLLGILAGFTSATMEHGGPTASDTAMILTIVGLILAIVFAGWKLWPKGADEPIASSAKRARHWFFVIMGFSVILGFAFAMVDGTDANPLFSNGPIDPLVATLGLIGWLIVLPALTWAWWSNVDEHEASAYRDSSTIAVHAYVLIVPAWWFASRAGWAPAQDPLGVLVIVSFIWMIAWFYRKYF